MPHENFFQKNFGTKRIFIAFRYLFDLDMKKWKISFFVCLLLLLITIVFSAFLIVDQAISISYMREGYVETENDLKGLVKTLNSRNRTKTEIEKLFSADSSLTPNSAGGDSIFLNRIILVFKDEQFVKVINQMDRDRIEVYLIGELENPQLRNTTHFFLPDSFAASDSVFISDSEILSYEIIETNTDSTGIKYYLNLTESGRRKMEGLGLVELSRGRKFAISVNGKPVYGGYFWNSLSSYSCDWLIIPAISSRKLSINAGFPDKIFTDEHEDPRGSSILVEAFAASQRLIRTKK